MSAKRSALPPGYLLIKLNRLDANTNWPFLVYRNRFPVQVGLIREDDNSNSNGATSNREGGEPEAGDESAMSRDSGKSKAAKKEETLLKDDIILKINGTEATSHDHAVSLFAYAGTNMALVVQRPVPPVGSLAELAARTSTTQRASAVTIQEATAPSPSSQPARPSAFAPAFTTSAFTRHEAVAAPLEPTPPLTRQVAHGEDNDSEDPVARRARVAAEITALESSPWGRPARPPGASPHSSDYRSASSSPPVVETSSQEDDDGYNEDDDDENEKDSSRRDNATRASSNHSHSFERNSNDARAEDEGEVAEDGTARREKAEMAAPASSALGLARGPQAYRQSPLRTAAEEAAAAVAVAANSPSSYSSSVLGAARPLQPSSSSVLRQSPILQSLVQAAILSRPATPQQNYHNVNNRSTAGAVPGIPLVLPKPHASYTGPPASFGPPDGVDPLSHPRFAQQRQATAATVGWREHLNAGNDDDDGGEKENNCGDHSAVDPLRVVVQLPSSTTAAVNDDDNGMEEGRNDYGESEGFTLRDAHPGTASTARHNNPSAAAEPMAAFAALFPPHAYGASSSSPPSSDGHDLFAQDALGTDNETMKGLREALGHLPNAPRHAVYDRTLCPFDYGSAHGRTEPNGSSGKDSRCRGRGNEEEAAVTRRLGVNGHLHTCIQGVLTKQALSSGRLGGGGGDQPTTTITSGGGGDAVSSLASMNALLLGNVDLVALAKQSVKLHQPQSSTRPPITTTKRHGGNDNGHDDNDDAPVSSSSSSSSRATIRAKAARLETDPSFNCLRAALIAKRAVFGVANTAMYAVMERQQRTRAERKERAAEALRRCDAAATAVRALLVSIVNSNNEEGSQPTRTDGGDSGGGGGKQSGKGGKKLPREFRTPPPHQ